jgi:hypothetical protein
MSPTQVTHALLMSVLKQRRLRTAELNLPLMQPILFHVCAGKVAERRWYERNKHIFPASRWEVYDPRVSREGAGYTIHGGEVNEAKK